MEIIDQKKVKQFIRGTIIFVVIFFIIPLIFYYLQFHKNGVSNKTDNWADFGSYFGGIVGTLLNLVAAFFSLISIYITLLIAQKIQESENAFNKENKLLETKLTYIQSKPFPYLDQSKYAHESKINLANHGVGPMIVTQLDLIYNGTEHYRHFSHLFNSKNLQKPFDCSIEVNTAPDHIITPGTDKTLLRIFCEPESVRFSTFQKNCHDLLKDTIVHIDYQDIFGNSFSYQRDLVFFG